MEGAPFRLHAHSCAEERYVIHQSPSNLYICVTSPDSISRLISSQFKPRNSKGKWALLEKRTICKSLPPVFGKKIRVTEVRGLYLQFPKPRDFDSPASLPKQEWTSLSRKSSITLEIHQVITVCVFTERHCQYRGQTCNVDCWDDEWRLLREKVATFGMINWRQLGNDNWPTIREMISGECQDNWRLLLYVTILGMISGDCWNDNSRLLGRLHDHCWNDKWRLLGYLTTLGMMSGNSLDGNWGFLGQ